MNYKISDTKLKASWQKDKIWKIYYCSNCQKGIEIEHTTILPSFCPRCGFNMKNPELVKVEIDWD